MSANGRYVKEYAILAALLHKLTKKNTNFPKPWTQGSEYDLSFMRLKAILLDTNPYLHHKTPEEMLFITKLLKKLMLAM